MANIQIENKPGLFGNLGKSPWEIHTDIGKRSIKCKMCSTISYGEKN